jgi:hypothetical protein
MHRSHLPSACALAGLLACSSGSSAPADGGDDAGSLYYPGTDAPGPAPHDGGGDVVAPAYTYGPPYTGGQYALGPVDYAETKLHNACAPASKYSASVQSAEGPLLASLPGGFALWGGIGSAAGFCDACIWVTTPKGRSALLRVVSYGVSGTVVDTSQGAFQLLDSGESPRAMTWQFAQCPSTGPMILEFSSNASDTSTSLWVRNARVPLAKVEVLSQNHPAWIPLKRENDGSLSDANGFGVGPFQIRVTGVDGQEVTDSFSWPTTGLGGAVMQWVDNFG